MMKCAKLFEVAALLQALGGIVVVVVAAHHAVVVVAAAAETAVAAVFLNIGQNNISSRFCNTNNDNADDGAFNLSIHRVSAAGSVTLSAAGPKEKVMGCFQRKNEKIAELKSFRGYVC